MRIFDFEKIVFWINVAVIGLFFFLLAPTTHIVASWYPRKDDALWLIPVLVLGVCALLWLLIRFSIPGLIKIGFFDERRADPRPRYSSKVLRFFKIVFSTVAVVVQLLLLIGLCMGVIAFMRSQTIGDMLTHLMKEKDWEEPHVSFPKLVDPPSPKAVSEQ